MPAEDMVLGRSLRRRDPIGHVWYFATHNRDLTTEEMAKGAEAVFALPQV
jgi:hypothetical protein